MSDEAPRALYLVMALLLVLSSLIGSRIAPGKALKMATAWIAIFGVVFVLFAFRGDFSSLGQRLKAEAMGRAIAEGSEIRIPISDDGHYWVDASINGHEVRFLVDSGATLTTISRQAAEITDVQAGSDTEIAYTANGPVPMQRAVAKQFNVGGIERSDFAVRINAKDDTNVLGMNFLSTLNGWRVEGTYLVLRA